jgi:hypothetical protein
MLSLQTLVNLKQQLLAAFRSAEASRSLPFTDAESSDLKRAWLG